MNIKQVNPLAKGSSPSGKTIALGPPRMMKRVGDTLAFNVQHLDTGKAQYYRIQVSQAELELLIEHFNQSDPARSAAT